MRVIASRIAGCAVNLVALVGGDDLEPFWQPFDFRCFLRPTGNTNQGALGTPHCFCLLVKYFHRTYSAASFLAVMRSPVNFSRIKGLGPCAIEARHW